MTLIIESGLRVLIAIKRRVGQNGRCFAGKFLSDINRFGNENPFSLIFTQVKHERV